MGRDYHAAIEAATPTPHDFLAHRLFMAAACDVDIIYRVPPDLQYPISGCSPPGRNGDGQKGNIGF